MSASDWCLIESDPGCFTELIRGFGVTDVNVEEIYGLDEQNFRDLHPTYGLIFLFKWQGSDDTKADIVRDSRLKRLFFAKQVINNACATQAILSILLNAPSKKSDEDDIGIQLGETLSNFKEFTKGFDPTSNGLALSNEDTIRCVHNTFARQQMFEFDAKQADKDDDVFHFISYIPFEGRLYELDGLREGPVDLGVIPDGSDWISIVRPVIEKRMQQYSNDEIQFNLMAVVKNKMPQYKKKLAELEQQLESGMVTDTLELQMAELRQQINEQDNKTKAYKIENIRRKHNHLPLIIELLKQLSAESKLMPLTAQAKTKALEQREVRMKRKMAKMST